MPSRLPAPVEPLLPNHRSQTKSHPVLAELTLRSGRKQCVPCRHKAGEGRFHIMEQLAQSSFITSSQFARKHPGGRIAVQESKNSRIQEFKNGAMRSSAPDRWFLEFLNSWILGFLDSWILEFLNPRVLTRLGKNRQFHWKVKAPGVLFPKLVSVPEYFVR